MRKHAQIKKANERGFALLVVFLVAAGIMISLYLEIPRVAFESQRQREEILIERGEQYSRAIEVFFRKNKRYPQKIEDLESYNNIRFLRRRYKDPLTGKDEWRMVHMGPNGQLADSLVEKAGVPGQTGATGSTGATGTTQTAQGVAGVNGATGATGDTDVNVAQSRLRASDRNPTNRPGVQGGPFTNPVDPNNPNAQQPAPFDPNNPQQVAQQFPPQGAYNPNAPPQQGPGVNPFPFQGQNPQYPAANGINPNGVQPGMPQQVGPGAQGFSPGAALQGQLAAQSGQDPSQAGFGQNPALSAINNNLRNQPSAANGLGPSAVNTGTSGFSNSTSGFANSTSGFGTPVQTSAPSGGQSFGGGGIAGVASTQAGIGIKKYNDKSKYKEWEFIFDYRKPKGKAAAGTNIGTGPNGQPGGTAAATGASTSGFNSPSGFGTTTPPPQPPPQQPPPNQ